MIMVMLLDLCRLEKPSFTQLLLLNFGEVKKFNVINVAKSCSGEQTSENCLQMNC